MADTRDYDEEDRLRAAAAPATDGYTGNPCPHCGRIRVYRRVDGQLECEKCERVWRPTESDGTQ